MDDFEIREYRQIPQGRKKLLKERTAYLALAAKGYSTTEACRIVGINVQTWLNNLVKECQCCAQGKDAARPPDKRQCCSSGDCCESLISERTARDAWTTLRNALNSAVREELLSRNVASLVRVPKPRRKKEKPWSVEEARRFLESARRDRDPMYPAYVQVLVLGFRRGEALGVTEEAINWDAWDKPCDAHGERFCPACFANHDVELLVEKQVQQVGGKLHRREVKTILRSTNPPARHRSHRARLGSPGAGGA